MICGKRVQLQQTRFSFFLCLMPNFIQSIQGRDIGHLRIVARLWGIELEAPDMDNAAKELSAVLLNPKLVGEIISALPDDACSALDTLVKAGGRLSWAAFSRLYGDICDAGPGRRDRERMYLDPTSVSEVLFYRAFLARAFFDLPSGAQEFAYIPDDLLPLIHLADHGVGNGEKGINSTASSGFPVNIGNEPLGRPTVSSMTPQPCSPLLGWGFLPRKWISRNGWFWHSCPLRK
jgi:hypothetical protein